MRFFAGIVFSLVVCTPALTQDNNAPSRPPESLLPADAVAYFRFDGIAPHCRAYEKTALAAVMKDGLGKFVGEFNKRWKKIAQAEMAVLKKQPDGGQAIERMQTLLTGGEAAGKYFWRKGCTIAVQLCDNDLQHMQVTAVFPDAYADKTGRALHDLLAVVSLFKMKQTKLRGRTIYEWQQPQTPITPVGPTQIPQAPVAPAAAPPGFVPNQPISSATVQRWSTALVAAGPPFGSQLPPPSPAIQPGPPAIQPGPPAIQPPPPAFPPSPRQPSAGWKLSWWREGNHIIVTWGTEPVARLLDVIDGKRPSLAEAPLYRRVNGFKRYETCARGYVDLQRLVHLLGRPNQDKSAKDQLIEAIIRKSVLNRLGLSDMESLSFHFGFEGKYQRSTAVLKFKQAGNPKGLLRMFSMPVKIDSNELPPLPPDASAVHVFRVDWGQAHDEVDQLLRMLGWQQQMLPSPRTYTNGMVHGSRTPTYGTSSYYQDATRGKEKVSQLDFWEDFLSALDSTIVVFDSAAEGPLFFGQGVAIRVKDADKLQRTLERVFRAEDSLFPTGAKCQKRTYRGAAVYTWSDQNNPYVPCCTVYKGWFVAGVLPQTVKGYIRRAEGDAPSWKMPALAKEFVQCQSKADRRRGKLAYATVHDPRPHLEEFLSMAPILFKLFQQEVNHSRSRAKTELPDAAVIPPARSLSKKLFPGVTAFYDDGDTLRCESHSALVLPCDCDTYLLLWIVLNGNLGQSRWNQYVPAATPGWNRSNPPTR